MRVVNFASEFPGKLSQFDGKHYKAGLLEAIEVSQLVGICLMGGAMKVWCAQELARRNQMSHIRDDASQLLSWAEEAFFSGCGTSLNVKPTGQG